MENNNRAVTVIASAGNLPNEGAAGDLVIAYNLATGLGITYEDGWDDLPLGAGSTIISFAKSDHYKGLPDRRTYGEMARAFLNWRIAKMA